MTAPTYNYQGSTPRAYECAAAVPAYCTVKIDTAGKIVVTTAITDDVEGISLVAGATGEMIPIQQTGVAKVKCSAAVTIADQVMPGANGKCATAAGATAKSFGKAQSTSANDAEIIMVRLALGVNGPANS